MKFVRRNYQQEAAELNITAFLNLMVILVPFLLITAVFSRMTVLELNLPGLDAAAQEGEEQVELSLQLVVRDDRFEIRDATLGEIRRIERQPGEDNWELFRDVLLQIKTRFPEEQDITLLLEPGISYNTMIAVMDHVRMADVIQTGSLETIELFPNIAIGDAPPVVAETQEDDQAAEPAGGTQP